MKKTKCIALLLSMTMLLTSYMPGTFALPDDADITFVCGQTAHMHSDTCYEQTPECALDEHIHTDACLPTEEPVEPAVEEPSKFDSMKKGLSGIVNLIGSLGSALGGESRQSALSAAAPTAADGETRSEKDIAADTWMWKIVKVNKQEVSFYAIENNDPFDPNRSTLVGGSAFPTYMTVTNVTFYNESDTAYCQLSAVSGSWSNELSDGCWLVSSKLLLAENWCESCLKENCGLNHDEPTEPPVIEEDIISGNVIGADGTPLMDENGNPIVITVEGELPEGAVVVASAVEYGDAVLKNVFDIKILNGDGTVWQPMDDDTSVIVSVPIQGTSDGFTARVNHFIDYTDDIDGDEEIIDITDADEETKTILANAIEAYGDGDHVAVEVNESVTVENGVVKVETNSFSLFTAVGNPPEEPPTEVTTYVIEDLKNNKTLYARPGEWIRLTTNYDAVLWESWSVGNNAESDGIVYKIDGGGSRLLWWGNTEDYCYIYINEKDNNNQTVVNKQFTITYSGVRLNIFDGVDYTITVVVEQPFDWGKTYITLLNPNDNFPVEPLPFSTGNSYQYCYLDGTNTVLGSNKTEYTMYPRTLIDVDAINKADVQSDENGWTYGIVDYSGEATKTYLKFQGEDYEKFEEQIIDEYFETHTPEEGLTKDRYKLVVYAVKFEAVGDHSGWYIACKVAKDNTFLLSYDYNEPSGFFATNHLVENSPKLPQPEEFKYSEVEINGVKVLQATVTVRDRSGMKMQIEDGNRTYTADFLGWSTDKDATDPEFDKGQEHTWTIENDTILYAIWSTTKPYTKADVQFTKRVVTPDGASYDTDMEFEFTVDQKFYNLKYSRYGFSGQLIDDQKTFTSSDNTFKLKADEYVVIYSVPNHDEEYTITEAVYSDYTQPVGPVTTILINDGTNKTGKFNREYTNTVSRFEVRYLNSMDTVIYTEKVAYGENVSQPPTVPERTGYTGIWNHDGNNITVDTDIRGIYTPIEYHITYSDFDSNDNPAIYTVEQSIVLNNPVKNGYTFAGWTGTDLSEPTLTVTISKGSIGDRSFTATWTENTVELSYVVVGPDGVSDFGSVTPTSQTVGVVSGKVYENGLVAENAILGSTAAPATGFIFKGWYSDADCTQSVGANLSLKPAKSQNELLWTERTYYAKFDYGYTSLTITAACSDPDQSFIFTVKNVGDTATHETVDLQVVLHGSNDSVTVTNIPIGNYIVTEVGAWSWRYPAVGSQTIGLSTGTNEVKFEFTPDNPYWLSGDSYKKKTP